MNKDGHAICEQVSAVCFDQFLAPKRVLGHMFSLTVDSLFDRGNVGTAYALSTKFLADHHLVDL
jgi:hypothetical protein